MILGRAVEPQGSVAPPRCDRRHRDRALVIRTSSPFEAEQPEGPPANLPSGLAQREEGDVRQMKLLVDASNFPSWRRNNPRLVPAHTSPRRSTAMAITTRG